MRIMLAVVLVAAVSTVRAAEEPPAVIKLTLQARAIESPALKYRLLPAEAERKAGNAVPILLRLPWEQQPWMNKVYDTLPEWEERPLTAPEWKTSAGVLPENFYQEMKRAAFRREAVWEYPIGEQQPLYYVLLPDVQGLRRFLGDGLSARIRYQLTRGELEMAREGIMVGMANARHLAQTPFYVNQLVAASVQGRMLKRVEELIEQPNSPNLYWALTTLPDSLLEVDRATSLEADGYVLSFPGASDLDRDRDVAEWKKMAEQLVELLESMGELPRAAPPKVDSLLDKIVQQLGTTGGIHRTSFVEHGRVELAGMLGVPAAQVAAMSDEEVGIRWYVMRRVELDHRRSAIVGLPPREAWPLLMTLHRDAADFKTKVGSSLEVFEAAGLYISLGKLHRKIQALRVVEAIRHHAAGHDGELPESLDHMAGLAIPLDPLTDQPFLWTVVDGVGTLKAPALPADVVAAVPEGATSADLVYELRIE